MSTNSLSPEAPWRSGLRGARANLLPGLALWAFASALVGSYYFWPAAHAALERLAVVRAELGVWYAVGATGVFGGLIPYLYLRSQPAARERYPWRHLWFFVAFWCYKGFEVDALYRLLAHFVGTGNDLGTLVIKMLVDQFVYCPLVAVPGMTLAYNWRECGFSVERLRLRIAGRFFSAFWLPTLIANLGVWMPAVMLIYALPLPLQIPLFNVVLCFFTLLLAHMAARSERAAA